MNNRMCIATALVGLWGLWGCGSLGGDTTASPGRGKAEGAVWASAVNGDCIEGRYRAVPQTTEAGAVDAGAVDAGAVEAEQPTITISLSCLSAHTAKQRQGQLAWITRDDTVIAAVYGKDVFSGELPDDQSFELSTATNDAWYYIAIEEGTLRLTRYNNKADTLSIGGSYSEDFRIAAAQSDLQAPSTVNVASGKALYDDSCLRCHGAESGDFVDARRQALSYGAIVALAQKGLGEEMPAFAEKIADADYGNLVAYLRTLGEAAKLLEGIIDPTATPEPAPAPAPTTPSTPATPPPSKPATSNCAPRSGSYSYDAANGKALYTKYCKSCHGRDGLGVGEKAFSPALDSSVDFSSAAFKKRPCDAVYKTIANGDGNMPSYKKKPDFSQDASALWDVVNYVLKAFN